MQIINAEHHLRVGLQYRFGAILMFLTTFSRSNRTNELVVDISDVHHFFSRSAEFLVDMSSSDVVSLARFAGTRPSCSSPHRSRHRELDADPLSQVRNSLVALEMLGDVRHRSIVTWVSEVVEHPWDIPSLCVVFWDMSRGASLSISLVTDVPLRVRVH